MFTISISISANWAFVWSRTDFLPLEVTCLQMFQLMNSMNSMIPFERYILLGDVANPMDCYRMIEAK